MQSTTILNDKQTTHHVAASPTTNISEKAPVSVQVSPEAAPPILPPDAREQLYNEGSIGPIDHVQVSTERIVKLRGILFDIDPTNLREGALLPGLSQDPEEFYKQCVQRWLSNHPLLQNLEVRVSGTGLHAILWLDRAVEFANDAKRKRWCSIVKIVQAILPTDPLAPGITATIRVLDSINTKNGQTVRRLKEGTPVSPADVIALQQEMCAAPFGTVFQVLAGADRMSPCPFCSNESLVALQHVGKCYNCGKITFERLCNELFKPRKAAEVHGG